MKWLVASTGGLASGILLRSLFVFDWQPLLFVFLLGLLFATAAFFHTRTPYLLGALFLLSSAVGILRTNVADTPLPQPFATSVGERVSYTGTIVGDPDVRDSTKRIPVRVASSGVETTLLAVVPRTTEANVGDHVWVSGTLDVPEPFSDNGGRVFRYDQYLAHKDIRFLLNFAYLRVDASAPWWNLSATLARVKHVFLDGLNSALPEPYSSLAGGIVIGGKSGLGNTLQDAFVRSGLIQIIVLSGYNVMVVAEWLMAACASLRISKRTSAIVGALAVMVFVGIAGASATALRAMSMAFIALYARATGRSYAASRALLFTIILMLLWNPGYLVFDPGFGLSVVATAGLIWLAPGIETWFGKIVRAKESSRSFWRNALATTLAAQIAVLPLLLYDTGNLSLVAIPANLITMPMVPLAMGFSALAGIMGVIFHSLPFLAIIIALPAYVATGFLLWVSVKAANVPFAAFTIPAFSGWIVFMSYAALVFIATSKRFSTTLQLRFSKKASM